MKRLRDELPEGFEASLVKVGQGGEPTVERRAQALEAALGVLAANSAAPLGAKVGVATAGKVASGKAAPGLLAVGLKALLASAALSAVVVGSMIASRSSRFPPVAPATRLEPGAPVASAHVEARAPSTLPLLAPVPPPAEVATASPRSPATAMPQNDASIRATPPAGSSPRVAPELSSGDLSAELAAVDEAGHALSANRPDEALRILAAYDQRHPHGMLAREAELRRIEALVMRGDRTEALHRARALQASPDASPGLYKSRLRAIFGEDVAP